MTIRAAADLLPQPAHIDLDRVALDFRPEGVEGLLDLCLRDDRAGSLDEPIDARPIHAL